MFLKVGFDPTALRTEIAVRGSGAQGPWVPITASGLTWFEEPIFDGFALPRCPPWYSRQDLAAAALGKLDAWLDRTERQVAGRVHAEAVLARLTGSLRGLPHEPEARPALYVGMSLGLTFPFNILLGLPVYLAVAQRVMG